MSEVETVREHAMTLQKSLILFAHGARDPAWAEPFERLRALAQASLPEVRVALAFLELMTPGLPQLVQQQVAESVSCQFFSGRAVMCGAIYRCCLRNCSRIIPRSNFVSLLRQVKMPVYCRRWRSIALHRPNVSCASAQGQPQCCRLSAGRSASAGPIITSTGPLHCARPCSSVPSSRS